MSGNLFGDRYIGMRVPAWHHLGITSRDQMNCVEAFAKAGLNYKYHVVPIGATLPNGVLFPVGDQSMVAREPTPDDPNWRNLGIVSAGYTFLQNEDIAAGMDTITKKTGWNFETAGALGRGETIFVCLNASTQSVHGDEVKSYFLVSDGKSANRALKIQTTPVRVVCQNTLIAAGTRATKGIVIPHTQDVAEQFKIWTDLISDLEMLEQGVFEDLRQMGSVKIDDEIARRIFKAAFPEPVANDKVIRWQTVRDIKNVTTEIIQKTDTATAKAVEAFEYNMEQSRKWQAGAFELYEKFNNGAEQGGRMTPAALETLRQTPYAALQAVTELCDWGGTNRDSVASATLFGARANQKAKAFETALYFSKN